MPASSTPSVYSPAVAATPAASREERRRAFLIGVLIFALSLVVRCIGLGWGLPNAERWYSYHPDESARQIVGAVVNILQGEHGFNPRFFNYPSLSVYATWLIYQIMATLGLTTNVAAPTYPWPILRDIIIAGRVFSVLCGAGTAVLVWGIAQRLGLRRGALLAALLTALAPGFVQHSHFATVDVPATFFVTLCVWLTLRATNTKAWLGAAFMAGLAAGTKYNVGLVLVVPLVALWVARDTSISMGKRISTSLGCIAAAAFAFLISTPYALLDFPTFWGDDKGNGFYFEAFVHPKIGSDNVFLGTGNGWWYHFSFNLPFVLTWPLVIAALVGISFVAKKRDWWPVLAFIGLFFFSLSFSQVRFMRYLIPLAPLLCLLAAYAASRLPKPQVWGAVVALFALLGTTDVLTPFVREDPRDSAAKFITGRTTTVGIIHNPWFYTPPFQPEGDNALPRLPYPIRPVVTGDFTSSTTKSPPSPLFVVSEFETREDVRLNPQGKAAQSLTALQSLYKQAVVYGERRPILPGRAFVPHDYLYASPKTTVYSN